MTIKANYRIGTPIINNNPPVGQAGGDISCGDVVGLNRQGQLVRFNYGVK